MILRSYRNVLPLLRMKLVKTLSLSGDNLAKKTPLMETKL